MTTEAPSPSGDLHRVDQGHAPGADRATSAGTRTPRPRIERRRHIDPTTCERDYDGLQIEFMTAMDDYKRRSGRQFPTWSEVLEVLQSLGYRKVAEPCEIEM